MKVITLGSFDLMHPGHIGLFQRCRELAGTGTVTVAINTDQFMARYKKAPILTYEERATLVRAVRHIDRVIPNDGTNQQNLLIGHDLIVIGSDWARKDYLKQLDTSFDYLDANNIALCYVPRTGDWSTTEIKTRHAVG